MARSRGAVGKLGRREGEKLFLKGERCFTPKCAFERRGYPPGHHGKSAQFRRRRESDYNRQLRAKQKGRRGIWNVGTPIQALLRRIPAAPWSDRSKSIADPGISP